MVGGVRGFDANQKILFYLRTENNGTERVLESVSFKDGSVQGWSDNMKEAFIGAMLTPKAQFLLLDYLGPALPYRNLVSVAEPAKLNRTLFIEPRLREELGKMELPRVEYTYLPHPTIANLSFNAKITYPVGFRANRTQFYPVLVNTYGGPNSQTITKKFGLDVHSFMASQWHKGTSSPFVDDLLLDGDAKKQKDSGSGIANGSTANGAIIPPNPDQNKMPKQSLVDDDGTLLNPGHYQRLVKRSEQDPRISNYLKTTSQPPFVIVQLDVRGTGFRGEGFRFPVTGRLGETEAQDVIDAVGYWITKNDFVDAEKIGFWGWSFGGFMASKIAEKDVPKDGRNSVFKASVAVAPVTHWLFYDSVYTERYMKLPKDNAMGYTDTAIHDMSNFANLRFLVMHGTADDNVHVQQTLHLLHQLQTWNQNSMQPSGMISPNLYRGHLVPDDRHSMSDTTGAFWLVHRLMVDWFVDTWKEVDRVRGGLLDVRR